MSSSFKQALKRGITSVAHELAIKTISPQQFPDGDTPYSLFMERVSKINKPVILELGTRRSIPDRSTRHEHLFPGAGKYIGTDIQAGIDVDVIADIHRLSQKIPENSIDIVFTDAGFEHFKYPHLAAWEIMKVLRVGGLVFVQTHQTFPIHAVPYDYCRFSREALASLFGQQMGCQVHATCYASPAAIYSRVDPMGHTAPAFLHVSLFAEKVAPTPKEYIYEYDCDV
jgi:Methyltransferase domain